MWGSCLNHDDTSRHMYVITSHICNVMVCRTWDVSFISAARDAYMQFVSYVRGVCDSIMCLESVSQGTWSRNESVSQEEWQCLSRHMIDIGMPIWEKAAMAPPSVSPRAISPRDFGWDGVLPQCLAEMSQNICEKRLRWCPKVSRHAPSQLVSP